MEIIHAHIITMEQREYSDGYLRTEGSCIAAVGSMEEYTPLDDEVVDAQGALLLPGFIDGHCHIGMWEDGVDFEGDDGNEDTDPVTPQLSAIDAINPIDHCFEEALDAGITTVVTGPGSANPIGGSWIAMNTVGRRIDEMLLKNPLGMKFALGENPKNVYHGKGQMPVTRMATAALIREQLMKAKRYLEEVEEAEQDEEKEMPEYDAKCEALLPVLRRQIKAFFHAHRSDDIFTAMRLAKEFELDLVLVHATEGYKVADILARESVAIIGGPIICDRSKPELKSLTPQSPALLAAEGLQTAICTDHPVIPIQYLSLSAAVAHAKGLERLAALEAITILPAKLCGIDDMVGSLAPGKHADFCLFRGDPLGVCVQPEAVFVNGKKVR